MEQKLAIVLLSGGLDACTCLCWALSQGYRCHALSFDYGQLNSVELEGAKAIAKRLDVAQTVVKIDLSYLQSPLLSRHLDVPFAEDAKSLRKSEGFSPFTVPGRNLHFMAHGMSLAESLQAQAIIAGFNGDDHRFSDCSKEFVASIAHLSRYAINSGPLDILAPLIELNKPEILKLALQLSAPIELTLSCYRPKEDKACGQCDACVLRIDAFRQLGLTDPAHPSKV